MAGRRIYITIPQRDADLLRRVGVETGECMGMVARRYVLTALYKRLWLDKELMEYDAEQARLEREEMVNYGR